MTSRDIRAVAPPPAPDFPPIIVSARRLPTDARGARAFQPAQEALVRHEQLAVLGERAAMIVHELRSPLSTVAMALEYVAREDLSERARKRVEIARREEKRLNALVSEILHDAQPRTPAMAVLNVNELLREVIEIFRLGAAGSGPAIAYHDAPQALFTCGDRDRLKQAFINLVANAWEAVSPHQTVRVALERDDPARAVRVVIRNDGHIRPQDLERLTAPFYSTKPGGTGLGLAIVQRIVDAHDGILNITSRPDQGVCVTVGLGMSLEARPGHG